MEEAQHAKLDTLMVEAIALTCTEQERDDAVDGYLDIGGFLDAGSGAADRARPRKLHSSDRPPLSDTERAAYLTAQRQATRWTFLGSGMSHPNFLATIDRVRPGARERLEAIVPSFS